MVDSRNITVIPVVANNSDQSFTTYRSIPPLLYAVITYLLLHQCSLYRPVLLLKTSLTTLFIGVLGCTSGYILIKKRMDLGREQLLHNKNKMHPPCSGHIITTTHNQHGIVTYSRSADSLGETWGGLPETRPRFQK